MKTAEEYVASLRNLRRPVYWQGRCIENVVDDPSFRPHINAAAKTYEMAENPVHQALATTSSHLTGEQINVFTHIPHSPADLVNKVKVLRAIGQQTGSCFQRCVGWDALSSLYSTTYDIDHKEGTSYHGRLREFLTYVQKNDLMSDGAMTDPKGDRNLPPHRQPDPDQYVRIVERRSNGIVVRGAKIHQTGAINSHEIIVMPTSAMGPEDRDYAVSFAVPADTSGVVYIFGRQTNDGRKLEGAIDQGNASYGLVGGEALVVFEDVFVPWERVFLCGEGGYAGALVERFASYHRQNYGGCKVGVIDVLIGATLEIADMQGVLGASHVRDKITEMVHLNETLYAGSLACSYEGKPTASGSYFVDPLLANITKLNVTRFIYEVARLAQDIAGGFIATMPTETDLRDPVVGKHVERYLSGAHGVCAEHRMRIGRLIENMTGGTALVEAMHGAGSPQAMRIMIGRQANVEHKRRLARRLAGVPDPAAT